MRTPLSLCLLGALTLLGAARATAQPGATPTDAPAEAPAQPAAPTPAVAAATAPAATAPSSEAVQQAKQDIESALSAQGRNDFDKAIIFYRRAYRVLPHPILLFNAAQALRLSGRPGHALALFQRYVAIAPNTPQAAFAREIIERLELHAVPPVVDPTWDDPTLPPRPPVVLTPENTEAANFWKWSLIGTTSALALATGYYAYARHEVTVHAERGQVRGDQPFDSNCPDGVTRTPGFQRACTYQQRENIALYTMIGTSILSLTSLVMWVQNRGGDPPKEYNRQPDVAFAPVVTSTGGGATVSMRW
jgi:tetratricopeptide (TPR) repeat protein